MARTKGKAGDGDGESSAAVARKWGGPRRPRTVLAERNATIVRLRNEGNTLRAIGDAHGLTITSVAAILKKARDAGSEVRRFRSEPVEASAASDQEILRLRCEGKTLAEIAAVTGLRQATATRRLRRLLPSEEDSRSAEGRAKRNAKIIHLCQTGAGVGEISDQIGLDAAAVRQIVASLRHKGAIPPRIRPDERAIAVESERIAAWAQGQEGAALAALGGPGGSRGALRARLGVDETGLQDLAVKAKIERAAWISRLRVGGWTYAEIGKAFGISIERARQLHHDDADEVVKPRRASVGAKRERDTEIVRLRKAGLTLKTIAETVGVSAPTVLTVLNRSGCGGVRQERREEALRLYNAGLSAAEVARRIGVADMTVRAWLRLASAGGKTMRASAWKTKDERAERNQRIVALREAGVKLREIAAAVDMTIPGVSLVLKRAGFVATHQKPAAAGGQAQATPPPAKAPKPSKTAAARTTGGDDPS